MYTRNLKKPLKCGQSFFLFGPRGVGKTTWLLENFKDSIYIDLLKFSNYQTLLSTPSKIEEWIPTNYEGYIIIDAIQKIPQLLNEVHRLIENRKCKFILTGSSARSLRKKGVNLLAGRALTYNMHCLTAKEMADDFDISSSLQYGHLPGVKIYDLPNEFLESYIKTYLQEEVLQEALTRNIGDFAKFLEISSLSQGSVINLTEIAREVGIDRQKVSSYFNILEDLLIAKKLSVFNKKTKRRLINQQKFYFFDVGVFNYLRPKGPLDQKSEILGIACETLVYQELIATLEYNIKAKIYFWRTSHGTEVEFIVYGDDVFAAIEVKSNNNIKPSDLRGLKSFRNDYEMAKCYCFYMGDERKYIDGITIIPIKEALFELEEILNKN